MKSDKKYMVFDNENNKWLDDYFTSLDNAASAVDVEIEHGGRERSDFIVYVLTDTIRLK